jgi:hypothetical protein
MASYPASRQGGSGSLGRALLAATQWRLLLLWLLGLALPTLLLALPLWSSLAGLLDHSVHAAAWARSFSAMMLGDTLAAVGAQPGALRGSALASLLCLLLLAPFLSAMAVGSGRAGRPLGIGHLLQCGVVEYGRMFRLALWSLLPYAAVAGVAAAAFAVAGKYGDKAVLESQAELARHAALWVLGVVFVLAQAAVESARAAFIADLGLRSATRALGRGIGLLLRHPLRTLLCYLLITAAGYVAALALGVARLRVTAAGGSGFLLALLASQGMVLVMGWTRIARLFALAEVARVGAPRRRGNAL